MYRGIDDFKKGYQSINNIVEDERGNLVADSHNIFARWRNQFSRLFDVHRVHRVGRQKYTQQNQVPLRLRWLIMIQDNSIYIYIYSVN